jgi:quinol monooxygenase YgiN
VKSRRVRWERERVRLAEAGWARTAGGSGYPIRGRRRLIQEVPVFIAILDFRTAATDRSAALAQFDREGDRVRAMPGNVAFRVYAAREDDTAVTIVHEWDDEPSFAGYLRSDSFAKLGEVIRPMMIAAPVSRRFRADLLETVA